MTRTFPALRSVLPALVIALVGLPVFAALYAGIAIGDGETWDHILSNRLVPYTLTTLTTLAIAAMIMLGLAVPTAWLTNRYQFPGRAFFSWALILPLAMPGYVMAYAWADLMGVAGPLQSQIRDVTGLAARDYWFPNVFSVPGLAFILASTLFPYVYITARAAFSMQSLATLEAAKSLGANGFDLFWRVALPVALPTILGGLCLALMEAAADYGAADFLGIQTLGVGIIRSWTSFGEPNTAARLALMLIIIAASFVIIARTLQGRRGVQQTSSKWRTPPRTPLPKSIGICVSVICSLILLVCFFAPLSRLIWLALETRARAPDLMPLLQSTIALGFFGTGAAFVSAIVFTLAAKRTQALRLAPRARPPQ